MTSKSARKTQNARRNHGPSALQRRAWYLTEALEPRQLLSSLSTTTALEGQSYLLQLTPTPPSGSTFSSWDITWGDSQTDFGVTTTSKPHLWGGPGSDNGSSHLVSATVHYTGGSSETASATISIAPKPPSLLSASNFDNRLEVIWVNQSKIANSFEVSTYNGVWNVLQSGTSTSYITTPDLYSNFKVRTISAENPTSSYSESIAITRTPFTPISASAEDTTVPGSVTLHWAASGSHIYRIYRKIAGDDSWGDLLGTITQANHNYFTDSSAAITSDGAVIPGANYSAPTTGVSYEYCVRLFNSSYEEDNRGFVAAGSGVSEFSNRGTIVVVVEQTKALSLWAKIERLQQDLIGDGWKVILHLDGPSALDITSANNSANKTGVDAVWKMIHDDYINYPDVKQALMIGHLPVPYSGQSPADSHTSGAGDHQGAWSTDAYYGDMTGSSGATHPDGWTDTATVANTVRPANANAPGDGKFDQDFRPNGAAIAVGRIDMWGMFDDETRLLAQYLDKDHAYRQGQFTGDGTIVPIGTPHGSHGDISRTALYPVGSSVLPIDGLLGSGNVVQGSWFPNLSTQSRLWAFWYDGLGAFDAIGSGSTGVGTTTQYVPMIGSGNFEDSHSYSVFNFLSASFLDDFNTNLNILRAPLANDGYGLISFGAALSSTPELYFQRLGLGSTIGDSLLMAQNNNGYGYIGNRAHTIALNLMGDPTLRMDVVAPVPELFVEDSSGHAKLTWKRSVADPGAGQIGEYAYYLYAADSLTGTFTRVTATPTTTGDGRLTWTDPTNALGAKMYMVRAVRLENGSTISGSYYNASQGTFGVIAQGPANIVATDIGSSVSGATAVNGTLGADYDLSAAGAGIGGTGDNFRFTYRTVVGGFDLRVKIDPSGMSDLDATTAPNARAGLMVRLGLDAGAKMVFIGRDRSAGAIVTYTRTSTNASASSPTSVTTAAKWVRLQRDGNTITAYYSTDDSGSQWMVLATTSSFGSTTDIAYVGLATSSQGSSGRVKVEFRGFGDASQYAMKIWGSNAPDQWYFRLQPSHPENLEVYRTVADPASSYHTITLGQPNRVYPINTISQILLQSYGGNDTVTLDFSNGLFWLTGDPLYGVRLSMSDWGGDSNDTLIIKGTPAAEEFSVVPSVTSGVFYWTLGTMIGGYYQAFDRVLYDATNGSDAAADSISIGNGATIVLNSDSRLAVAITSGGTLDIVDHDLVLDYTGSTPISTIRSWLSAGRGSGAWTGTGIVSSSAAAYPGQATGIGFAEASYFFGLTGSQTAMWSSQTIDATTILLKYTWYGDANLDGEVNPDDYTLTDRGHANPTGYPPTWRNGDFDNDDDVDTDDYLLIDRGFALQTGVLSPEFIAERITEFGSTYGDELQALVAFTGTGAIGSAVAPNDVGSPSVAGSTTGITPGADYDLTAGGTGFASTADQFHFAWQLASGDFDVRVRIDSLTSNGASDPLAGLMVRAGLAAGDKFVFMGKVYHTATSAGAFKGLYRTTTDATPTADTWPLVADYSPVVWVRLRRSGSTIYAYYGTNGTAWTLYYSGTSPNGSGDVYVGLAATAGDSTHTATASFRELAAVQTQSALTLNLTSEDDVRYFRLDATGHTLRVWDHRPADPDSLLDVPTWTYDYFAISSLTINALAGDDSVYFDFANGFINFTSGITYAGGDDDDSLTYVGTPAGEGFVRNNENSAWWIANTDQYYLGISYGNDTLVHFTDVEHHLFEGNGAPSGSNWDSYGFSAGTWAVGYDLGANSPKLLLNVSNGVDVTFSASQHLSFFQITGTGSVTLSGTNTVLVTSYIVFQNTWSFDLADGKFVFDWTGTTWASQFVSMLHTAYDDGTWDGGGFYSTLARNDPDEITGIGWAETSSLLGISGSQTGTWAGQSVDASSLVFKRTYFGDTDLDGDVDQADLDAYAAAVTNNSAASWQTGDFNYDGVRDSADYALMMDAYANQTDPL